MRLRLTAVFDDDGDYDGLMEALQAAGLESIEDEVHDYDEDLQDDSEPGGIDPVPKPMKLRDDDERAL